MVRASCKDGVWQQPYATTDKTITLHVAATGLQYGQQVFEGLKAFRGADGRVRLFRMRENARRMAHSAEGLLMTPPPEDLFCEAIRLALRKNIDYLPPYETGATLYFRPILVATSHEISVAPGRDCELIVVATPIGAYFPVSSTARPSSWSVTLTAPRHRERVRGKWAATTDRRSAPQKQHMRRATTACSRMPKRIGILTNAPRPIS